MHVAFRILLPDTLDDGVERTNGFKNTTEIDKEKELEI